MGLRNPTLDHHYGGTLGMDSSTPLGSTPEGFVRKAWNCDYGLVGGYSKRFGYADVLTSVLGSYDYTAGMEWVDRSGVRRVVWYGTNGVVGELHYLLSGGTTLSSLSTGYDGTKRPCFVGAKGLLFMYMEDTNPVAVDGVAVRQVGITKPSSAPTGSVGTAGSMATGSYLGFYTYVNEDTGAESSPSPASTAQAVTGPNGSIAWTVVAGDATTATHIYLYRTVANGNVPFFDTKVAIGLTSISSTQADAGLGAEMEFDNSRITEFTSTPKYPTLADNRIFVVTGNTEIRWSKYSPVHGFMYESFQAIAFADAVSPDGDNDEVIGLNKVGETPIVLKEKAVGRMESVGFVDPSLAFDGQFYQYKQISPAQPVSQWGAVELKGGLVILCKDNIYVTDGQAWISIADSIAGDIQALGWASGQVNRISAENDVRRQRIYFHVFSSSSQGKPDYTIVGDYQRSQQGQGITWRWAFYGPGPDRATHPGWKVASLVKVRGSDGSMLIYGGNHDLNGQLYLMNSGTSDRGSAIWFEVQAAADSGQTHPEQKKLWPVARIWAKGAGSDYDLTVDAAYDLSSQFQKPRELSLLTDGDLWDVAMWDVGRWAGSDTKQVQYRARKKSYWRQLRFLQTEVDAPVTIFGWTHIGSRFRIQP